MAQKMCYRLLGLLSVILFVAPVYATDSVTPAIQSDNNPAIKNPSSLEDYLNAATFFSSSQQWGKAIEMLQKADQLKPNNIAILGDLARSNLFLGNIDKSKAYLERARDILTDNGDNAKAQLVDDYIKILPKEYSYFLYQTAMQLGKQGMFEEAKEKFRKSLVYDPRDREAPKQIKLIEDFGHGKISKVFVIKVFNSLDFLEQKKYDQMIPEMEGAIKLYPNYARAYNILGLAYGHLNRPERSIAAYQKAIEIEPNYATAYYGLGMEQQKKPSLNNEALANYRKTIELDPTYDDAYVNIGDIYLDSHNLGKCVDYEKKAITINPTNQTAYFNIGNCLLILKKYQESMGFFEKAIDLDPFYPDPYNGLGRAFTDLGNYQKSIGYFEKTLLLDLTHPGTNANLGYSYQQINNNADAVKHLKLAIEQDPKDSYAYFTLGWAYNQAGESKKAAEILEEGIKLDPNNSNAFYNLGKAYWRLKNAPKCREYFTRAKEIYQHEGNNEKVSEIQGYINKIPN